MLLLSMHGGCRLNKGEIKEFVYNKGISIFNLRTVLSKVNNELQGWQLCAAPRYSFSLHSSLVKGS